MTTQVIETKRQPPLWSVKVGNRFKAVFTGPDARAQAETFARAEFGEFTVVTRPIPERERRRLAELIAK